MSMKDDLRLVIGFMECEFDDFQEYLEEVHDIESTEAERIIASLEKRNEK